MLELCAAGLVERGLQWRSSSKQQVAAQVQGHLSFMEMQLSDVRTLQQVNRTRGSSSMMCSFGLLSSHRMGSCISGATHFLSEQENHFCGS